MESGIKRASVIFVTVNIAFIILTLICAFGGPEVNSFIDSHITEDIASMIGASWGFSFIYLVIETLRNF